MTLKSKVLIKYNQHYVKYARTRAFVYLYSRIFYAVQVKILRDKAFKTTIISLLLQIKQEITGTPN